MHIDQEIKLDFKDVLIQPKRSQITSRSEVDITREFEFLHSSMTWHGVPIIAANMDTVGTFEMADVLADYGLMTALHKHYPVDELAAFHDRFVEEVGPNYFYSIGITEADVEKLKLFQEKCGDPTFLCIDVANGYSLKFRDFIKRMRDMLPQTVIMAGNVVTGDMVYDLITAGADIAKVGIGPGSVCTTRVKTGVGFPQLSATIECADAAHQLKGFVCADGGCTVPGDVAKALAGGADFVMLGGMFAGHDESGGELVERRYLTNELDVNGQQIVEVRKFKKFYGMSSSEAMEKHYGQVADYRASEGKCVEVEYRGPVSETVKDILGGLRSACSYVGAKKVKHLSKHTTFIRVTQQENRVYTKN